MMTTVQIHISVTGLMLLHEMKERSCDELLHCTSTARYEMARGHCGNGMRFRYHMIENLSVDQQKSDGYHKKQ